MPGGLVRRIAALRAGLPWWLSLPVVAVAGALVFGVPVLREMQAVRDHPIEHAEVVAVKERGGLLHGCGKGDGTPAEVTWRSSDPPSGRPATFTDRRSCDGDVVVGETHRLDDSDPAVYVDPATTWGQVGLMSAVGAGTMAFVMVLVLGGRAILSRWLVPAWQRVRNGTEYA